MNIYKFCVLIFFALISLNCYSQPLQLERIGLKQGLSQSTIYAIAQDKSGYIWIATADGVNIYDGYEIIQLRHNSDDSNSLSDNYARALLVAQDGDVLIGTLGGGLNRYDPKTKQFKVYRASNTKKDGLISDDIYSLYQSKDGAIWIGSEQGVSKLDPETSSFIHLTHDPENINTLVKGAIRSITQTRNGDLWFGSSSHGLSVYSSKTGNFKNFQNDNKNGKTISDNSINFIYESRKREVWIATEYGGLNKFNSETSSFIHYPKVGNKKGPNDSEITSIIEDNGGRLWLGTWSGGINVFNPKSQNFEYYRSSQADLKTISSNTIISLFQDHSGILWAGSFDAGINRINHQGNGIIHYTYDPLKNNGLTNKMVWSFSEDINGIIWIGTKKGLNRFAPNTGKYKAFNFNGRCNDISKSFDIRSIVADEEYLWIGTAGDGLLQINPSTCELYKFINHEKDSQSLSDNNVRLLHIDKQNRLWIGTSNGLNRLDIKSKKIIRYLPSALNKNTIPHQRIRAIYESDSGDIWIGTSGGLSHYNGVNGFTTITAADGLLSNNDVRSIYQDKNGIIWIATGLGLTRYNPIKNTSKFFHEKDGLSNETLYSIVPDGKELWISTNIGISRINIDDFNIKNYYIEDGLQSNEFNFNAYLKSTSGDLYFGGVNGFNRIITNGIGKNITHPKLNLQVSILDEKNEIRLSSTAGNTPVELMPYEREIIFTISVLHNLNSSQNKYKYKLVGYDATWRENKAKNKKIKYSGIPPGRYTFKVIGYGSNDVPTVKAVEQTIEILPSYWVTTWAYMLYMLILTIFIWVIIRLRILTLKKRNVLLKQAVKEKTSQLNEKNHILDKQAVNLTRLLKNQDDFYLRVAHELRTPLMLISLPAEQLRKNQNKSYQNNNIEIIIKAVDRLKRISDQMLHASEHGLTHTAGSQTFDLTTVLEPILFVYSGAADNKKIIFKINKLPEMAVTSYRQILEDVLHNILSNAVKYTEEGGQIDVNIALLKNILQIEIIDSGIGINLENQPNIFERWHRSEEVIDRQIQGDGIGLYTVKKQLDSCGGNIELTSEQGCGSIFKISMPCHWTSTSRVIASEQEIFIKPYERIINSTSNINKETILIIEDNNDIQTVLSDLLGDQYNLIVVGTAAAGLDEIKRKPPSITLCDVMLPDGNGHDIAHSIKSNEETSHIPVIILTAAGDFENRNKGWGNGADDYILKPFAKDDLLFRINALIENRKRLQKWYRCKYMHEHQISEDKPPISIIDTEYLSKLEQEALILIKEGACNLENLAEKMGSSSRTLQRKIIAMLDRKFPEYINSLKLKSAKKLLLSGVSIKCAASESGYKSSQYFSKIFKEQVGMTPSMFQKQALKQLNR